MKFPQVWQVWSSTDVKLRTEGLPGIHQRFIPKKRSVCSRERTKRFVCFFPFKWCRRNATFKITYHHCSADLMRFWNLLIDREGLVKSMKTWWKLGEIPKSAANLKNTLVNFLGENPVKSSNFHQKNERRVFSFSFGEIYAFYREIGFNLVKLQNLVKTWWKPGEFPKLGENLDMSKTW